MKGITPKQKKHLEDTILRYTSRMNNEQLLELNRFLSKNMIFDMMNGAYNERNREVKKTLEVGDTVYYSGQDIRLEGKQLIIKRIKRTKATCTVVDGHGLWNIPIVHLQAYNTEEIFNNLK